VAAAFVARDVEVPRGASVCADRSAAAASRTMTGSDPAALATAAAPGRLSTVRVARVGV
jgi:hypothetical protein